MRYIINKFKQDVGWLKIIDKEKLEVSLKYKK